MLTDQDRHIVDGTAVASTIFAGITLQNSALVLTVIATFITILLGVIRIYDRIKYGPGTRGYR